MLLSNDRLNSSASDAQIYGAEIFKILFEILSNPTAFPVSQVLSKFKTCPGEIFSNLKIE